MIMAATMFSLLVGLSHAQDAPYYLRDTKANQDMGGLNRDLQEISSSNNNKLTTTITPNTCPSGQALLGTYQNGGGTWGGTCTPISILNSTQTFTGTDTFQNEIKLSSGAYFSVAPSSPTPKNTLQRDSFIKGWAVFSGTTTAILQQGINVSSVTYLGTGAYRINWKVPFASKDYAVSCFSWRASANRNSCNANQSANPIGPDFVEVETYIPGGAATDSNVVDVIAIGAQ